jgi:hypothetical protein
LLGFWFSYFYFWDYDIVPKKEAAVNPYGVNGGGHYSQSQGAVILIVTGLGAVTVKRGSGE